MNQNKVLAIATTAVLCVGIALTLIGAMAQGISKIDKTKIVGSWTQVSVTNTSPDGKTVRPFGPNDGFMMFDANGRFVKVVARFDLPKFVSNNRNTGSPEENKAVVQGSVGYFGTYTANEDGTLTLHIERSSFPNWNGTDQKYIIVILVDDEMKLNSFTPSMGGTAEQVFKRIK
jgi:hypothetical protein